MQYGDISNDIPQRIIVTTDVFVLLETEVLPKKYKVFKQSRKKVSFKKEVLSQLFLWAVQTPYVIELASFNLDQEDLQKVLDTLDKYGTNPFRHCVAYESVEFLVKQLPYRPEILGVIDRPDRLMRYGHWGMDLTRL
jgi:hypothetical protein